MYLFSAENLNAQSLGRMYERHSGVFGETGWPKLFFWNKIF